MPGARAGHRFDGMRAVVGFDGSEGAQDAVELTKLLCGAGDEALLVNVLPFGGPVGVAYSLAGYADSDEVRRFFAEARSVLGDVAVQTRSFAGESPARAMSMLAESDPNVDVAIVGSPHRGALGRTFLGSVAENLLQGSSVPIAVAPRGYAASAPHDLGVVGVAFDGGAEATVALAHAVALAEGAGARLLILTVEAPNVPMPGLTAYTPPPGFDAGGLIEEALAVVGGGVECEAKRLAGPIAPMLARACQSEVDLLVAGSRGYGPLGRVLLGSVTASLICKAPCPVLVVPRARTPAHAPVSEAAGIAAAPNDTADK
jgi:nucleotide-binding universal stress UspA family protein